MLGSFGLALFIYLADYIPLSSNLWLWVFALQSDFYSLFFMSIGKPKQALIAHELVHRVLV